jgi:hypothetical protein
MPYLFNVSSAGAKVIMQTRDEHCEAHVHAINTADGWEAVFEFFYADEDVRLREIRPASATPKKSELEAVMAEIWRNREHCRATWWRITNRTCLENKTVVIDLGSGMLSYASPGNHGAMKVKSAIYLAGSAEVDLEEFSGAGSARALCP